MNVTDFGIVDSIAAAKEHIAGLKPRNPGLQFGHQEVGTGQYRVVARKNPANPKEKSNMKKHPSNEEDWVQLYDTAWKYEDPHARYIIRMGISGDVDRWYLDFYPDPEAPTKTRRVTIDERPGDEYGVVDWLRGSAALHYDSLQILDNPPGQEGPVDHERLLYNAAANQGTPVIMYYTPGADFAEGAFEWPGEWFGGYDFDREEYWLMYAPFDEVVGERDFQYDTAVTGDLEAILAELRGRRTIANNPRGRRRYKAAPPQVQSSIGPILASNILPGTPIMVGGDEVEFIGYEGDMIVYVDVRGRTKKVMATEAAMTYNPNQIPGGVAAGMHPDDFNQHDLMAGTHVELEHTLHIMTAMEIAMDHLAEDPDYYRKLATIHNPGRIMKAINDPSLRKAKNIYEDFWLGKEPTKVSTRKISLPTMGEPMIYLGDLAGIIYASDKEDTKQGDNQLYYHELHPDPAYPKIYATEDKKTIIIPLQGGGMRIADGWLRERDE